MRVLNLDIDAFVSPIRRYVNDNDRPDDDETEVWSDEKLRQFLEQKCGLSTTARVEGVVVNTHAEVMRHWARWIESGTLEPPFDLVHIGAHDDLGGGFGDVGILEVCNQLIHLPVQERTDFEAKYMDSGNYLLYALAYRWIGEMVWVRHPEDDELSAPCVDGDRIQLEPFLLSAGEVNAEFQCDPLVEPEPVVPFTTCLREEYLGGGFDLVCIAKSPGFTPAKADYLIDVAASYLLS